MSQNKRVPRHPRLTLDLLETFSDQLATRSERAIIALNDIWQPLEDGAPLTLDDLEAVSVAIVEMQLILNKMDRRLLAERRRIMKRGEQADPPQEVSWTKEKPIELLAS